MAPERVMLPASRMNGHLAVFVIRVQVIGSIPKSHIQVYLLNLGSWPFCSPFEGCPGFQQLAFQLDNRVKPGCREDVG